MANVCGLCGKNISFFDGRHYAENVVMCDQCHTLYTEVFEAVGADERFQRKLREFVKEIERNGGHSEIENLIKVVKHLEGLHSSELQEIAEVNNNSTDVSDIIIENKAGSALEYLKKQVVSYPDTNNSNTSVTSSETTGMYGNIAGKIKTLAQVVAWLGIIGSVVSWLVLVARDEDLLAAGLIIAVIGSLISWVSSFVLYGYGQLIENTDKLVELTRKNAEGANKSKK